MKRREKKVTKIFKIYLGLDDLNRGLVKNVDIQNKEATIFFCDFGSEINIQVF